MSSLTLLELEDEALLSILRTASLMSQRSSSADVLVLGLDGGSAPSSIRHRRSYYLSVNNVRSKPQRRELLRSDRQACDVFPADLTSLRVGAIDVCFVSILLRRSLPGLGELAPSSTSVPSPWPRGS